MSDCPDDNVLAELVDGTLPEPTRNRIERHLDGCDSCTSLVAELAWVVAGQPAPPGYRFARALGDATFEAIELRTERRVLVELGAADPRLARFEHANVAPVHEIDNYHVVTDLPGLTARAWCADRTTVDIVALWQQVLAGLAALHRAGIVHGRVTPDHVFVVRGRALLGGFARPVARTSGYVAPELLAGASPSPRSDQLAAAVSLWELLTGKKPFAGATAGALAVAMSSPPEPPATLDRELYRALRRALASDPARRWPDVEGFAAALGHRRSRRAVIAIAVGAVVAVAALLGYSAFA